jgi:hypothetical protein
MSLGAGERPRRDVPSWTDEAHVEALTVAMIVAPGVYARNRMFELMSTEGARRARVRARMVLGMIRQLAKADRIEVHSATMRGYCVRFAIHALRFSRGVDLSAAELAALLMIAEKAGVHCPRPQGAGPELVARALGLLLQSGAPESLTELCRDLEPRTHEPD